MTPPNVPTAGGIEESTTTVTTTYADPGVDICTGAANGEPLWLIVFLIAFAVMVCLFILGPLVSYFVRGRV